MNYGGTAIDYRVVRSGDQGRPIKTTHAFIWLLTTIGLGSDAGGGASTPGRWLRCGGATG
eukprot:3184425-Pleurochrysis_carterae.AAC.1